MSSKKRHQLVPQDGKLAETTKAIAGLLAELEQVEQAIALAETPEQAIAQRNHAEALRLLARCAHLGLVRQNIAARLRILAEMKAGEMLIKLGLPGGDRKSKTHGDRLKLEDLDIDHNESSRYQKLALLPKVILDEYASWANSQHKELTYAGLIRWAANGKPNGSPTISAPLRNGQTEGREASFPKSVTKDELEEVVDEIQNHRNLLAVLLRPLYEGQGDVAFERAERRYIGKLLTDMGELLAQLKQLVLSEMQAKQRLGVFAGQ